MLNKKTIEQELEKTLEQTAFDKLGAVEHGKVRDSYKLGDKRVIVTTDRISAFDRVLGTIPFKGQVLNQLAAFWFEQTRDITKNHIIDIPDPNVMVVAECEQLPLEFIVRGYITGVTKTSLWYNYSKGVRNLCGIQFPDGLQKNQKLAQPVLTPTTKLEKHDRPLSREEALSEGLMDAETFDKAAEICFKLYTFGSEHAAKRGLILVDTKYELGRLNGEIVVSDEIHTPDSSRYWFADTYQTLFEAREEQRKIDKEYVREWLADHGFRGEGNPPALPDSVRVEAARRYIEAYETITGREFEVFEEPIEQRIISNLTTHGYIRRGAR